MFATKTLFSSSNIEVLEAGGTSFERTTGNDPRVTWRFIVRGADEASDAYDAVYSFLSTEFLDGDGNIASYNLPLSSIKINSTDSNYLYEAEVEFSPYEEQENVNDEEYEQPTIEDLDYSYSTTGGTSHVTHSIATLGAARSDGGTPLSFGLGIGWNGESFDGVDVSTPAATFSISVNWPKEFFTQAYRLALANATGRINSAAWNGFGAGCVLFKGVTARPVAFSYTDAYGNTIKDYYWRSTYDFEARPSSTITFGGSTLTKRGFDYVWKTTETDDSGSGLTSSVSQINVEQVYPEFDFANLNLPFPE